MIKIGVISDTHDNIPKIKQAIEIFNKKKVSLVIHAGDIVSPFALIPFKELKAGFVSIFGNNDGDKLLLKERAEGRIFHQPYKFEYFDKKIVVMHEPDIVEELAISGYYDLIIYGHTHRAKIENINNTLIVNPGEAGGWLYGKATIAIIELENMVTEIIDLI